MKTTQNIRSLGSQGFTLIELLVVIAIIAILAGFALPVFTAAQKKGRMTDSMSNAKQIGTALRMYAGDHDAAFPATETDGTMPLTAASFSNRAYENLMPKYSTSKKIFPNRASAYCRTPVAESSANANKLEQGHNDWGYVLGLVESSDARFPLGCTAPIAAATPEYSTDTTVKGGVWAATNAVIIYVDGSAKLETCSIPSGGVAFAPRPDDATKNILAPEDGAWLNTAANPLLVPE
jgi:prepilin-type N-terminal cleavage/methylation domain-containing protein